MTLRRSPMVLALLACIALAGCNGKVRTPAADAPATVNFQHLNGTTEVKKHPQRVVVLDYASLETLQLLGVEPLALPGNRTMLPDSLKQYQNAKYLNAGTLFEPDMATLRAAKPDLILIAGRSSKAYAELSGIAPTLNMAIDPQDQLGSLKQRTLQLGELFDKQPQAQAAVDKLDAEIAAIKPQVAKAGRGLVVLFSGGKISAYAPKSRFSFTYDALGFQSALQSDNADVRGNKLTPEQVAQLNPDWLFIIDRDAATGRPNAVAPQKILTTTALKNTVAVKKGQVVYLPAAEVYLSGGIITSQHIVERVAEALNKK
ncbi:MAG: siderophore ABC transporter substrate-binding protein [Serratia liquefaciens]|jgi:iron complex transport system substrate-binding protein|uniref:siderophore ABC transporter substrate-binding protein n=1 Tax=Serratia liquefaciens TaxID=614 RepID=UPI000EBE76CF|nr:siderophore ABC transporter substrate-binding protein [Serratia liquefaciens]MDU5486308.1 siderophore ABC transporter substrate-binding protein [Serratia liquefaciens]QNQ52957.1 siderophore ABC transporter substrate-binding protein [Serratia liquefaciens]HCR62851.1 iron ABC transporter substrate-binding protein [Serratia liquefaciens]HEJ7040490.1 siderophore ABC transporter substrate-binding protein [Serratia liquefaciens]